MAKKRGKPKNQGKPKASDPSPPTTTPSPNRAGTVGDPPSNEKGTVSSGRIKTALEIIGLVCTITGALGGLIYIIGKAIGIPWIVLTPDSTLGLTLAPAAGEQVELELKSSLVIDNRGLGNALITGTFLKADFSGGDPLQASSSDMRCLSSEKEVLSLPIPLPASGEPLRLECTASRLFVADRLGQLARGIQAIQIDFVTDRGKTLTIKYCVERDISFWQRLVKDPRPTNRYFRDALCGA